MKEIERIGQFESRFMIHTKEGMAIDWMEARNRDLEGFRMYVADRQSVRAMLKTQTSRKS